MMFQKASYPEVLHSTRGNLAPWVGLFKLFVVVLLYIHSHDPTVNTRYSENDFQKSRCEERTVISVALVHLQTQFLHPHLSRINSHLLQPPLAALKPFYLSPAVQRPHPSPNGPSPSQSIPSKPHYCPHPSRETDSSVQNPRGFSTDSPTGTKKRGAEEFL